MGNRAIITTVGRTTYKLEKNEGGKKERVYLCKDGNWYKKSNFPDLKPYNFINSSWPKILPEGTRLSDDYGYVYEIRNEKLVQIGYIDEDWFGIGKGSGKLCLFGKPKIFD